MAKQNRLICFLLMLLSSLVTAEPLNSFGISPLNPLEFKPGEIITKDFLYLNDPNFSLDLPQVIESSTWQAAAPRDISRGVKAQAVWMYFELLNQNNSTRSITLKYLDASYHSIAIYYRVKNSNGPFQRTTSLYGYKLGDRAYNGIRPTFEIDLKANQQYEVYARIVGSENFAVAVFSSFEVWNDGSVHKSQDLELFFLTCLFLLQLAIGVTAFIAFFSIKDHIFLFYALFAISSALSLSAMNGLWPYLIASPGYTVADILTPLNVMHLSAFIFASLILHLKEYFPSAHKFMKGWIAFAALGLILDLLGFDMASRYMVEISALNYINICIIAFLCWRRSVPDAGLLTITWAIFTIGAFIQPLRNWGVVEHSFMTQWMLYIGAFVEAWLLVLILALRLKRGLLHNEKLQLDYQRQLEHSQEELESQIKITTKELRLAKETAEYEARSDMLTGLYNRRAFKEVALNRIKTALENGENLHLIMIDLDHFKVLNDKYGHSAGDKFLIELGQELKRICSQAEIIARVGGDEFAILMAHQNDGQCFEFAESIKEKIEQQETKYAKVTLNTSASIGVASWQAKDTFDDLLHNADKALVMAKNAGKNRVLAFHQSWQTQKLSG